MQNRCHGQNLFLQQFLLVLFTLTSKNVYKFHAFTLTSKNVFLHPSQWNLYHKPHPCSVLYIPGDFAIFSKSNINWLDPHFSWGCPPTKPTETTKTPWWTFKLGSRIIMAGSHAKHRQRKASKQTTVDKNICGHSGPVTTWKAPPRIAPLFAR